MKYIRTKDGKIFTVVEKIDKTKFNRSFKYLYRVKEIEKINDGCDIIVDVNVVGEADTIEELCDGFYLDDDTLMLIERFYHYWAMGDNFSNDHDGYYTMYRKDFEEEGASFYGFIKTDKGLIYVAKMNDKGELELL